MTNNFFASTFSDFKGYNVAIFEVDKTGDSPKLLLHESRSSDALSIQSIADIIKPFTGDNFMGCYFNFVEDDTTNLIPNGVVNLIGGETILLKLNENPLVPLQTLGLKLGGEELIIKERLSGRVYSDFRGIKPAHLDEMSHQIANLIHVADNWDRLVNGANIEIRSERREPIVSDSLEGFLGVDRYYR
jgi:hypothetical protein